MLPPLIRRPRQRAVPRSRERGATMALVALAMVSIIAMAALSIDIGTLYEAKAEAQRAADAAALTAARVISISGITGDPNNSASSWQPACGGSTSLATVAATNMAQQDLISGGAPSTVTVNYGAGSAGGLNASCVGIAGFAVNPIVTVSVKRTNLPVFFARVFSLFGSSYSGTSVSATATAEVFNPSGSSPMIPVNPRCVKPWMVPNSDPGNGTKPFVDRTSGTITNPGTLSGNSGVIGETFTLVVDCGASGRRRGRCVLGNPPVAVSGANPTLDYVPGLVSSASIAIAANSAITACSDVRNNDYTEAVAGCDQSTVYACGVTLGNTVNLAEDPGPPRNDSVNGAACLTNASANFLNNGQDYLAPAGPPPYTYPFQVLAGANSALVSAGVASGSQITASPSIVSLPIYDSTATMLTTTSSGQIPVTVIGFLQVFINYVDSGSGNINVTVMNVSGCGNGSVSGPPVAPGTSPVPIRLITAP